MPIPRFQRLRRHMEDERTPELITLLEIAPRDLPMVWDADFNEAPAAIARLAKERLAASRAQ
jgi:hypothetical protein